MVAKSSTVNHHIHLMDSEMWPNPWELLAENIYCNVAKAIGMCYTLLLIGVEDVSLVEATDNTGNEAILVLVDSAKYILNYWPDTVVNNSLQDFTIKRYINIDILKQKIR